MASIRGTVQHTAPMIVDRLAPKELAERLALNEPHQWGPSDHCRVEIQVV